MNAAGPAARLPPASTVVRASRRRFSTRMSSLSAQPRPSGQEHSKDTTTDHIRVSVVIPCLNEAQNIEECVRRAQQAMADAGLTGEVVVADNASEDGSAELAEAAGAQVVHEPRRGYGSAYLAGF